mgnify:CR=1 FL=1
MLSDFPNKKELLTAASSGHLVLFLGAGVNVGCEMGIPQRQAPLGQQLANDLSSHFFSDEHYGGESLRTVCMKIQNIEGKKKLREALIQRLNPVQPAQSLLHITQIEWKSIYTVNIDYGLETAYSKSNRRVQDIVPIVLPSDLSVSDPETQVSYYKLHGCILKQESNLIFSHRDYTQSREKNLRLFAHLSVSLCESPLLFIGFGFEDFDFNDIWQSVKDYGGGAAKLQSSFLINPKATPSYIKSMESEGVTVIASDAATFLHWLKSNLVTKPLSVEDKVIDRGAQVAGWVKEKFAVSLPAPLADAIRKYCDIVSELPSPLRFPDKSRFLLGARPYWDDIQNGIPIRREVESDLIEDIILWAQTGKPRISLLLGAAGYGKTTLMMQAAYHISRNSGLLVLWLKSNVNFDPVPVAEFVSSINHPIIIFIDDASLHMSAIKRLYVDAVQNKLKLYIFIAARPSDWNCSRGAGSISIQSPWRLCRLTESEALDLAKLLKRSGVLEEKNKYVEVEEVCNSLLEAGEKHIIAGLKMVIAGDETQYHEIIAEEFYRIPSLEARRIYLAVAVAHSLGLPMPACLATRLVDIQLIAYHQRFGELLEEIVLDEVDLIEKELLFYTQHRVIADSLLDSVIDPASTVELLCDIAKNIDPHSYGEYSILRKIYDEYYLAKKLKEKGRVRSLYEYFMLEFPSDPYIRQHAAIFESKEGNFIRARELADEAIELGDKHPHFLNTKGTIWLREAVMEQDPGRAEYSLKKGIQLIRERIAKDSDKEIHYHSLIDKLLDWAIKKDFLSEEQRLRILEEAQEDLDNALRLYPTSSELNTLLGRLNITIEKIPEAEDKLRRSIFLDAGNVRARLMLIGMLIKNKSYEESLRIIEEGLVYASESAGLHKARIFCLCALGVEWVKIKNAYKSYLKISISDYRYRFNYIKELIQNSDYIEAAREVKKMREASLPYSIKVSLKADLYSADKSPLVMVGRYKPQRIGKGFIEIEGFPKGLDAYIDLHVLSSGVFPGSEKIVRVVLGLNGLGLYVLKVLGN